MGVVISKKLLLERMINKETKDIQERILSEYNCYEYFGKNPYRYIDYRMSQCSTLYQKRNRKFNLDKLFLYLDLDVTKYTTKCLKEINLNNMYCTREYLDNAYIPNPVDRFIFLYYFYGITDERDYNLRHLKVKDIDFKRKTLLLGENTVCIQDASVFKLLKEVIDTNFYRTSTGDITISFNASSPYLLKTRRKKETEDGCTAMKYQTLRTRMLRANDLLGTKFSKTSLKLSGIAHRLFMENSKKDYWTLPMIREWKAQHTLVFSENTVRTIMNVLYYHNSGCGVI